MGGAYSEDNVVDAGGSGLVGSELLKELLEDGPITRVYALTRSTLPYYHSKLDTLQDPELRILDWDDENPAPTLGFICLGSTLKQAGSAKDLAKVDYELVCRVAHSMKVIGVKRLAVVSSYGASRNSLIHYLRCKGKMETAIAQMGFDKLIFMRPGPLKGLRDSPRKIEAITHGILKFLQPLMQGNLVNASPIDARSVALAMLFALLNAPSPQHQILNNIEINQLLNQYHISS